MGKLLSVIVPVYNREQSIGRCIQSIRNQTYRELEILLIDDGSNDCSGEICEEYAGKDTRIRVYHRENSGASAARMFGISKANGELVTFVDSDDWIDADMYEILLEKCEAYQAEVVTSGITIERNQVIAFEMDTVASGLYEREQIVEKILPVMMYDKKYGRRGITGSLWNKIFSKELIQMTFSNLDTSVTYGDDALSVYAAIAGAGRIYVCGESWYHYCVHEDSLVQSYNTGSFEKIQLLKKNLTDVFGKMGLLNIMRPQIEQYIRPFLRSAIRKVYGMEMEQVSYLFPYEAVPCGSRIVIYGAGTVGTSYRMCLDNSSYGILAAWVDKNSLSFEEQGKLSVEPPERIHDILYDVIVIAVENRQTAESIKETLMKQGVAEGKIIWRQPKRIGC